MLSDDVRLRCAALVLAGCGLGPAGFAGAAPAPAAPPPAALRNGVPDGDAPPDARTLDCADYASVSTPLGRLSNNTWNRQAAGTRPWQQCLEKRTAESGETQYGWSWRWPAGGSPTAVRAYPEVVVGVMPWNGGPGNDSRLPRRIADTRRLVIDYDVETRAGGRYNLAASIWLLRTPKPPVAPDFSAIAAEIMVWTEAVPASFAPAGSKRAEVVIDGVGWEVWAAENWGDSAGVHPNQWTYVAYRAKTFRRSARYDALKLINDAVQRGLVSPALYIADVELGNEIIHGAGRSWLRRFSVTVE